MKEPFYYIQNRPAVGNCARWWRPSGHGYTVDLDDAWLVTKADADRICRDRPKEDIPFPAKAVDALAHRHVDVQDLRALDAAREKGSNPKS